VHYPWLLLTLLILPLSRSGPFNEGDITLGEYLVVFPFGWDFLFTLTLKGEDLITALENSVSLADQTHLPLSAGVGRFLSVWLPPSSSSPAAEWCRVSECSSH
jgi:hypothetical protein